MGWGGWNFGDVPLLLAHGWVQPVEGGAGWAQGVQELQLHLSRVTGNHSRAQTEPQLGLQQHSQKHSNAVPAPAQLCLPLGRLFLLLDQEFPLLGQVFLLLGKAFPLLAQEFLT